MKYFFYTLLFSWGLLAFAACSPKTGNKVLDRRKRPSQEIADGYKRDVKKVSRRMERLRKKEQKKRGARE